MTINELLYDAIKHEETFLAYSLYWSMQKGICKATDSVKTFHAKQVDANEVNKLIESNPLGIQIMKLFVMPTGGNFHLFVLAENEADAKGVFLNEVGILPRKVVDMTIKLDTTFWLGENIGYKSCREVKNETLMFPHVIGEYDKNTQKWRD
jgi:hypothetical protein